VLLPKEIELLGIAFDASYTLMYAPGTRRHTRKCVAGRCKMGEIIEVLKLCVEGTALRSGASLLPHVP